ncbi:hypothetical protein COI_0211 [Mannheimia haemolytica serotype A2 str. OVINE]|nr:hypothetical protein COI_0211 [Mannheimia haemolytica serotype A2 str. OVINE]
MPPSLPNVLRAVLWIAPSKLFSWRVFWLPIVKPISPPFKKPLRFVSRICCSESWFVAELSVTLLPPIISISPLRETARRLSP